ncbi:MAG: DNA repair protein RadC [Nitrospinae bacterium]|nr:DNA repair protein RadC [Nitrospinota bacterium]
MIEKRYPDTIKHWPQDERPRERLIKYGADELSDAQLLAIIIRTGVSTDKKSALDLARELITRFGNFSKMDTISIAELCNVNGIGKAKAVQIKAAMEIGKRMLSQNGDAIIRIRTSKDVVNHYIPLMRNIKKEIFKTILLDGKNKIIKDVTISEGSLTSSIVHPREVFNPAIKESASAIIFIHNHPSGDPTPSKDDIEITHRLIKAGEIIGIKTLDHIIIGDGRYFSFVDKEMMGSL